jgi:hypothetical protein
VLLVPWGCFIFHASQRIVFQNGWARSAAYSLLLMPTWVSNPYSLSPFQLLSEVMLFGLCNETFVMWRLLSVPACISPHAFPSTHIRHSAVDVSPALRSPILQLSKDSESTSLASIVATLIPTSVTSLAFLTIFVSIRYTYKKIYAPRTFMGTIPEKSVSSLGFHVPRCAFLESCICTHKMKETELPRPAKVPPLGSTTFDLLMTSSSFVTSRSMAIFFSASSGCSS